MKVRTTISVDKRKIIRARRLLSAGVIWESLSDLVESAIDTLDSDALITSLIEYLDFKVSFPSHKEVALRRSKVRRSSAKIVRGMRNERI